MRFWKKTCSLLLVAALAGCVGGDDEEIEQVMDAQEVYGCKVLNVFNAGEYIGEDVVSRFEKMYNVKVNYDMFESNEMMYTKLLGGNSYDVLVPSDYMIEQLIDEKMLQKVNLDQMTNLENVDPFVWDMMTNSDPDHEYGIPYFWGTVGIVYNRATVDEDELHKLGWNIFKDPKYKGKIFYYDSQRDGFMVAFKALGYSMNTGDEKEINDAYEWLREMNQTMEPAYVTDEVIDGMVNAEKDLAIMYSGDAAYVLYENMDMGWYEPDQGTNIWVDAMVIPANSACPGLANEFINYIISVDVQMENSEYVGYTSVDTEVVDYLAGEEGDFFENPAYTPRTDGRNDEPFHYNEELRAKLSDLWIKVKRS